MCVNALLSICGVIGVAFAVLFAIGEGYLSVWALPELLLISMPAVLFGALAYRQRHHRDVLFQSVVALVTLQFAFMAHSFYSAIYGAFVLLTQWFIGDFRVAKKPPVIKGAPDEMARVMWRRGAPAEAVRAALVRRRVPADEIEKLVYALASEPRSPMYAPHQ